MKTAATETKKACRPAKRGGTKRANGKLMIAVYVSEEEKAQLLKRSEAEGSNLSDYLKKRGLS